MSPSVAPSVRVDFVARGDDWLRIRLGGAEITISFTIEERKKPGALLADSRSDARRFVAELARQFGVVAPPDSVAPAASTWVDPHGGLLADHATLGRLPKYEIVLSSRAPHVAFKLWQTGAGLILDDPKPTPEAVVHRLAELLARTERPCLTTDPTLLSDSLCAYAWNRDGTLWAARLRDGDGCGIVRWQEGAAGASDMTRVPGSVDQILPSPNGDWLAILTCVANPKDGVVTSEDPREVWLVSATGRGCRKLTEVPHEPWGMVWSPTADRLALGGSYGLPRLRIVDLDGSEEQPGLSCSGLRVEGWTREGVITKSWFEVGEDDRMRAYRPSSERGILHRKWRQLKPPWWPSPCGRTEVSVEGATLHVRGAAFGSWSAGEDDREEVESIAWYPPTWCGPHRVVLGSSVVDLRTRIVHAITDETTACFHLAANDAGTAVVWRDRSFRVWRARCPE